MSKLALEIGTYSHLHIKTRLAYPHASMHPTSVHHEVPTQLNMVTIMSAPQIVALPGTTSNNNLVAPNTSGYSQQPVYGYSHGYSQPHGYINPPGYSQPHGYSQPPVQSGGSGPSNGRVTAS
jgi:hypothetical protein